MLWYGVGTAKDSRAAAELFQKAADAGNTEAMASLGLMYTTADGVPQNYDTALRLLKRAAEAGIARAQHTLGYLYQYGKGVPRDIATAARWFHAAGEQGYTASQTALAVMYYYDSAPADYQQAFEWASKAAQQGDPRATNLLGTMYNEGRGVQQDAGKAFEYFRQAAQSGDPVFSYNLGLCYSHGTGVKTDFAQAVKLIQPLADKGMPDDPVSQRNAQDELGQLYYTGDEHLQKNLNGAMLWFEKAARAGHLHAQVVFATMLSDRKRYKEAATWFRVAAERGDALAENNLGIMYANGRGLPKSRKDAIAWLLRAYQQGYVSAAGNLRKLGVNAK
jgi:TPR repeat protein